MPDDDAMIGLQPSYRATHHTTQTAYISGDDGEYRVGWIGQYRQLGLFYLTYEWAVLACERFDVDQPSLRHVIVPASQEDAFMAGTWPENA